MRVAQDATVVTEAERGSAAGSTYRANMAIAVVASAADSPSSSQRAIVASEAALEKLTVSSRALSDAGLSRYVSDLLASHASVVAHLEGGEVTEADRRVTGETLPLLDRVQQSFGRLAVEAASRIDAERASAGQTARISSFLVALVAPVLALWAYRRSVRRRFESERMEAELIRQRDLAAAQQSLIAGMSHQLRTPLTGIYGFAEALLEDCGRAQHDPLLAKEAAVTILGESNRLRGMIDDILVTARHEAGDLAYEHVLFDMRAEIDVAVEPFLRFEPEIDVDCPRVMLMGDRLRIRHVLRNLIDNALQHGRPPVRIIGTLGERFELVVEDHGDGPPPGDVFRTFLHTGPDALVTGSLGLGLGVCNTLCEAMGIDIGMRHSDDVTRVVLRWDATAVRAAIQHTPLAKA